jgi:mediator of RNA polymerase II transcription subunit 12
VQPVYAQLVQKLSTLVRSFILSSPGCFLLPDCWTKYEGLVESCFDDADKANQRLFCRLATRNQRLAKKPQADSANRPETSRQRLIVILDGVSAGFNLQTLSDLCLRTVEDRTLLITTVVEWATTPYRTGLCRLYIALRLLRCWSRAGLDLDGPLAAILGGMSVPSRTQLPKPLKLIAELVRSRHFSIGKYLQWLMARGPIPPTADEHTVGYPLLATPSCTNLPRSPTSLLC